MAFADLLTKRHAFALPETDFMGEFRQLTFEQETKAMADAYKLALALGLREDRYWVGYFEDCALLLYAMVQSGTSTPLFNGLSELQKSLSKEQIDYLATDHRNFIQAQVPKFDDLTEAKAKELLEDFFTQKKSLEQWLTSTNFRELKRLMHSSVVLWKQYLTENGLTFTSWNAPLMSAMTEPKKPNSKS